MCSKLPTCSLGSRRASPLISVQDYGSLSHLGTSTRDRIKVWCALLDMSKVFDLVDRGLLFELLLERNICHMFFVEVVYQSTPTC